MGKLTPLPNKGESKSHYKKRLIEFELTYWDFLKPKFLKNKRVVSYKPKQR